MEPVECFVDVGHLSRRDVHDVDAHGLVDERDLLAVGRPVWLIAEAGAEFRDRALVARAVGIAERELVLARLVTPVRDQLAVGRPRGRSFGES